MIRKIFTVGKRYWIPAIGWFLFIGFFNNCVLAPYLSIKTIEWSQLLTALAVMLAISGARDVGLKKKSDNSVKTAEKDGKIVKISTIGKRYWIPAVGWCLALGFFNNCAVYPYADIAVVEWGQLLTGLGVMLGISGTRDVFLNRNKELAEKIAQAVGDDDETEEEESKKDKTEKA